MAHSPRRRWRIFLLCVQYIITWNTFNWTLWVFVFHPHWFVYTLRVEVLCIYLLIDWMNASIVFGNWFLKPSVYCSFLSCKETICYCVSDKVQLSASAGQFGLGLKSRRLEKRVWEVSVDSTSQCPVNTDEPDGNPLQQVSRNIEQSSMQKQFVSIYKFPFSVF